MSTDQTRTRPSADVIAEAKAAIVGQDVPGAVNRLAKLGLLVAELPPLPDWPVGTKLTDGRRRAILTDGHPGLKPWYVYAGPSLDGSVCLSRGRVRGWTPVEDQPAADPARVLPDGHVAIDLSDIGTDELRRHHRSGSVIEGDGRGSVSSVFSGVLDDLIVCELERRGEAL